MADILKVTKAKELRGRIIEKLYISYGEDINLEVLRGLLRFTGNVQELEIKKAIYYLGGEGKRYVKLQLNEDKDMAHSGRCKSCRGRHHRYRSGIT